MCYYPPPPHFPYGETGSKRASEQQEASTLGAMPVVCPSDCSSEARHAHVALSAAREESEGVVRQGFPFPQEETPKLSAER